MADGKGEAGGVRPVGNDGGDVRHRGSAPG
jgi:hypothetical protein